MDDEVVILEHVWLWGLTYTISRLWVRRSYDTVATPGGTSSWRYWSGFGWDFVSAVAVNVHRRWNRLIGGI